MVTVVVEVVAVILCVCLQTCVYVYTSAPASDLCFSRQYHVSWDA